MTDETKIVIVTPSQDPKLPPYGQPAAWDAPEGVQIWGARWIYPDDQVYNRQGFNTVLPDDRSLQDWLNTSDTPLYSSRIANAMGNARALDMDRKMTNHSEEVVTLYEDDRGVIKGNPNKSWGYLYVAAWLKTNDEGVIA